METKQEAGMRRGVVNCKHCGRAFKWHSSVQRHEQLDCPKRPQDRREDVGASRYIVIENTPGYLSEDEDLFVTDDYAAAVEYMNARAAEYADDPDGNYRVEYGWASGNNYAAVMVWDDDKTHDLGRYIGVELLEEDDES